MSDNILVALLLSPFVLLGIWVAWQIFLESLRDKAVAEVSEDGFQKLADELRRVGSTESKSFFLRAPQGEPVPSTFHVVLPPQMDVDWLKSAHLRVSLKPEPESDEDLGTVTVLDHSEVETDFNLVPIPRIGFKNGGGANQYTAKVWFKRNPSLFHLAKEMYPRDPEGFLTSLLWGAGRLNSPFEWVQSPPRLRCKTCSKKLLPVLQIYGASVGLEVEADYFIAACPHEFGAFKIYMQTS